MSAARTLLARRPVAILGALAVTVAGLLAGLVLGPLAHAAGTPIQVAVHPVGASPAFGSGSAAPLLDTRALAALGPGGSVSGVLAVRNDSGDAAALTLRLANLDTCPPGAAGPCASAGAALVSALRFDVEVAGAPFGPGVATTQQTGVGIAGLQAGVTLAGSLPDQAVRWVRLTASLPYAGTGDGVQFGAVGFDLQLDLAGIASETIGPGGGGAGGGPLASTGVRVALLAGIAAVLLLTGGVLLFGGRRRARHRSVGTASQK